MTDERARERGPYQARAKDLRAEVERDGDRIIVSIRGLTGYVTVTGAAGDLATLGALLDAASRDTEHDRRFCCTLSGELAGHVERPPP